MEFIFIIFSLYIFVALTIAERTCGTPPMCCPYFQINKSDNNCSDCIPGYYGPYCNFTCRQPNYGQNCQSECWCTEEQDCNHISGCEPLNVKASWTAETQTSVLQNSKKYEPYLKKSLKKGKILFIDSKLKYKIQRIRKINFIDVTLN